VRVGVVNGRLSAASVARYRALGPLLASSLRRLGGVAAQSPADALRFAAVGVPGEVVAVTGSSKFDAQPWAEPAPPPAPLAGRPVLVAGSTRPGDEALVLHALASLGRRSGAGPGAPVLRPFLILAPRHLARLPEIERLLARRGLTAARRSGQAGPLGGAARAAAAGGADVLLLDTLGELAAAYELGWAGVVGGGFGAAGGHNLLEPAARGRAVLFGTRQRSAAGEVELLTRAGGGFACADADSLAARLAPLLGDREAARAAGERARAAAASARGAAGRAVAFLVDRLGLDPGAAP
jgi:3-deoxy-D-manno-octulosonic-acid transferase